ncbi:MAG: alpha-galactosidase [Planctomycetota bacterium]
MPEQQMNRLFSCRCFVALVLLFLVVPAHACGDSGATQRIRLDGLPRVREAKVANVDYLIDASSYLAQAGRNADGTEIILDNGLLRRAWRVAPNGACASFKNLMTDQEMIRSIRPEARVTVGGVANAVGGLLGQPNHAFLTEEWLDSMQDDPSALKLVHVEAGEPQERIAWGRNRHAAPNATWPPKGAYLRMDYEPRQENSSQVDFRVSVHYELYDGVPVICKWITLQNQSDEAIIVDRFVGEELAAVEHASWVEARTGVPLPSPDYLHVETDFCFGGMTAANANRHAVHWRDDPEYGTQVNYLKQTPCLLVCEPQRGPAQVVEPGGIFEGFRVFELAFASSDREHRGMAYRRMYRTIAPWVTENPLTHHLLTNRPKQAREAIDQAAEVGFEAIIFSFGSGFNMENRDPSFLQQWKEIADYAKQKGIELGSYSLLSSRGVGREHMSLMPKGEKATHGRIPSLASEWGQAWLKTVREFYQTTGFSQFENDGPYPGDVDITPRPPIQNGVDDSRWALWKENNRLYHGLRSDGVYINQPDYHYLNGGNKSSMGYREVNWSLPRAQQVIHTRQNIFDGTWRKTPSMGWMHVPLAQYHGGGAAATIEPLHQHLEHYERMLRSNLGMGVQAHYRGPRLYDRKETRDRVKSVVGWFKDHRDILESDLVHGRRADGRDLDWVLHVNPQLEKKGMLCVYNPLNKAVSKTLRVNLYYTGLTDEARVQAGESTIHRYQIARDNTAMIEVSVQAKGMSWYLIR